VGQMGFDAVEIFVDEPESINCADIRDELEANGLDITCCSIVGPDRDTISEDPRIRRQALEYIKRATDVAAAVGSHVFCGPLYAAVGKLVGRPRNEQEWEWAVEGIKEAACAAADNDVCLCIEPLNRFETYFINTAEDAVRLVREVDSPNVRVHLDTFHMGIEEKDLPAAIRRAGPWLRHVHISENDRGTPGTGHLDWDGIFQALAEVGYDQYLVIESFVLGNEAIAKAAAIWRDIAPSGDDLARDGLAFLREMMRKYS
ncbi:MAG: sugar phosphate isomerase/epimerase family protein, partial [Armatimonadota bacterium]